MNASADGGLRKPYAKGYMIENPLETGVGGCLSALAA
jgi:hypothetical protein